MQAFKQVRQIRGRAIAGPPFFRQPFGEPPKLGTVHLLGAAQDRFKRVPSGHILINAIARKDAAKRRIRKIPLPGVKAIALVDEGRIVFPGRSWLGEYHLPAIGVPSPFVEHKDTGLCEGLHYEQEAPQPKKDGLILTGSLP